MNKFMISKKLGIIFFLVFAVLFFAIFLVKAGTDTINLLDVVCIRHGFGEDKDCGTDVYYLPRTDYGQATIDYEIRGHRHGSSEIRAVACLYEAGNGQCDWFTCTGSACGPEYGGEHPYNLYKSGTIVISGDPSTPNSWNVNRYAYVKDAEVSVHVTGSATYPEAPQGTITATPSSCTALCNVTVGWTSNALSYGSVYVNGNPWTVGAPSDSAIYYGLTAGNYQFCLNGDDGFGTEVNVIDESTGQQACDTVTVVALAPTTYTLTVASTNPASGVAMTNTPDKIGTSGGNTQYSLIYGLGRLVEVIAPQTAPNGNNFSGWSNCDSPAGDPICSVTKNSDWTITANYATPPQADIQANASDGPISISYNSPARIYWYSLNADTCSVSSVPPGNFTNLPDNPANNPGGTPSGNLTANTTFTLTCNGPGGTATDSVEVRILGVTLTADPNSGSAPLNNVLLTATPTGTSAGTFRYSFDCNNGNEREIGDTLQNPYTIDSCSYSSAGTYTARVMVYHSWGVAVGTATITVSAPGAPTLTLTPNPMNLTVGGPPSNFTLRYDPDGSGPSPTQTVCFGGNCSFGSTWSSGNTKIAIVSPTGRASPVSAGSTTVTATYSGLTATATVIVTAVPVADLVVNGEADDDITVAPGGNASYVWTSTNATAGSTNLQIKNSLGTNVASDPCGNTSGPFGVISGTSGSIPPGPTCSTAGGYTYTFVYTVTGPGGDASDTVIIRLSTVIPPLSSIVLDFWADPDQGFSPLNSRLNADVSGTATGPINYLFWWNCTSNSSIVSTVLAACGSLPITANGTCSTNSVGYRCRAIDADSRQTSTHTYSPAGTYTGKVIVERGGARKEARTTITVTAPNIPPTVSSVTAIQPNYCVSGPAATVNWTYSDPEGNPQSAYQVQVDNIGSAWNLPLTIDTGKVVGSGRSYFTGNGIPPWVWSTTYKARVRVWDSNDAVSNWSESGSWTTPKHSYPVVNFTWSPLLDTPANQPIQFTDQTQLFDTSGVGQRAWNWLFGDGGSSAIQNPSHTYSTPGTFNVTETVADKDGYTCALTKPIGIDRPIPIWKEVSPR